MNKIKTETWIHGTAGQSSEGGYCGLRGLEEISQRTCVHTCLARVHGDRVLKGEGRRLGLGGQSWEKGEISVIESTIKIMLKFFLKNN